MVGSRRKDKAEWTSEGEQKRISEYVRRSVALRKQRSAYDGTRKRVCISHTKPGGTAGILILSQQVIAGTGFFVFQGGYFMFVYTKRWRSRAASEILNPHLNALKQT